MSSTNFVPQSLSDNISLIPLGNTLDNNNAEQLVQTILPIQENRNKYIIVDCLQLEFLSSAGVGAILGTIETSRENGGDIILCNLSESITHVLRVLDLYDFLTIAGTRDEAVGLCSTPKALVK